MHLEMRGTGFHLPDLWILASFILLTSCHSKLPHWNFILASVRDLIQERGEGASTTDHPMGTSNSFHQPANQPTSLDIWHSEYWHSQWRKVWCCMCSAKHKEVRIIFKCDEVASLITTSQRNCGLLSLSLERSKNAIMVFKLVVQQ